MDLVDLDKLLDDFEAEENAKTAGCSSSFSPEEPISSENIVENLTQVQLNLDTVESLSSDMSSSPINPTISSKNDIKIGNFPEKIDCLNFTPSFLNENNVINIKNDVVVGEDDVIIGKCDVIVEENDVITSENEENSENFQTPVQNFDEVDQNFDNFDQNLDNFNQNLGKTDEILTPEKDLLDFSEGSEQFLTPNETFVNNFDQEIDENVNKNQQKIENFTNLIENFDNLNEIDENLTQNLVENLENDEKLSQHLTNFEEISKNFAEISTNLSQFLNKNEESQEIPNQNLCKFLQNADHVTIENQQNDPENLHIGPEIGIPFENTVSQSTNQVEPSDHVVRVEETTPPECQNLNIVPANQSNLRQLVTVTHLIDDMPNIWKPTESELQLGKTQPIWIPDQDSQICMLCEIKFTLIKRRHHCRACGRVLCGDCCNLKAKLGYLENKDVRICKSCFDRLKKISEYEAELLKQKAEHANLPTSNNTAIPPDPEVKRSIASGTKKSPNLAISSTPAVAISVPNDSQSAITENDDMPGTSSEAPGPPDPGSPAFTVDLTPKQMPSSALKRSVVVRKESKRVIFSDGIKPGADPGGPVPVKPAINTLNSRKANYGPRSRELDSYLNYAENDGIPPVIMKGELKYADVNFLAEIFKDGQSDPVLFALKKNLNVKVKPIELLCCLKSKIWCFASCGLKNVAQDELLIAILSQKDKENEDFCQFLPSFLDVLRYFDALYDDVLKGKPLSDMTYGIANQLGSSVRISDNGFLGSKDNAGFLHFRPTAQCLKSMCLPDDPFLVGLLIQKSEVPWAKILPLRLALQLGAENNSYPWPIVSNPHRKPVITESGHTIMNLLNDFRNFTYSILHLSRAWVIIDGDKTLISIPIDQFGQVQKLLQSSNEHVLAFATSFCKKADSHLVCVQQPETGFYISKTVNKDNKPGKVSGGTFVIINASLKATGPTVRTSIVEDGVMIQVKPDVMQMIRDKLEKRENIKIQNESVDSKMESADDDQFPLCSVEIQWESLHSSNLRITSAVDGRWLGDAARFRLYGRNVEVSNSSNLIRLISLFVLPNEDGSTISEPDDLHSAVKRISIAVASALLPHSSRLTNQNVHNIGVRFTLGLDMVEYSVGLDGRPLPEDLVCLMDDSLIPALNNAVNENTNRNCTKIELLLRLLNL